MVTDHQPWARLMCSGLQATALHPTDGRPGRRHQQPLSLMSKQVQKGSRTCQRSHKPVSGGAGNIKPRCDSKVCQGHRLSAPSLNGCSVPALGRAPSDTQEAWGLAQSAAEIQSLPHGVWIGTWAARRPGRCSKACRDLAARPGQGMPAAFPCCLLSPCSGLSCPSSPRPARGSGVGGGGGMGTHRPDFSVGI